MQNDESNIIQIGLDPNNPFSRKSPTPRMHQGLLTTAPQAKLPSAYTGRPLNGSQLSLLSDRSQHQYYHHPHIHRTNALNLGIPHNEAPLSSYESPNGNMPRDLEDFDDLIKYSEELEQRQQKQQNHHPNLKAKGSNVSIGHSSGYQSIQTQSQSSSPIENVISTTTNGNAAQQSIIQQNIEFFNSKIQNSSSSSNASTANRPTKLNGKYGYIASPKYSVVPPLAFKNPLYQMQNGNGIEAKSSSLTPSSSEERITIDERQNVLNNNNMVTSSSNVPSVIDTSSLNGRRMGSNRVPRTNPLVQV
jgi:RAS protein activator-like 2